MQVLSRCCSVVCWSQNAHSSHLQRAYRIQTEKKKISERKKSFIYAVFHQHLFYHHSSINCDVFTSDTISQCYHYSDTKMTMAMAIDFVIVEIYPLYSRHVFYVQRVSSQFFHYVNCISYCKHVNVIMAAYNPCVYPVWKWYHLKMPFTFMCCLIKFVHNTNKLDCLG